jgi:hypothetical protein
MQLSIELQYFPSIISCVALSKSTYVDFLSSESWERRGFRNRMVLATANGLVQLTVPVLGGRNQKGCYKDIMIDHRVNWQKQHWGTIFSAYGNSPWFFQYGPELETIFQFKDTYLVDWNLRCLSWIWAKWFGAVPEQIESGLGAMETQINLSNALNAVNFQKGPLRVLKAYPQVFEDRLGFQSNLSVLDLLFCLGPQGGNYLAELAGEPIFEHIQSPEL